MIENGKTFNTVSDVCKGGATESVESKIPVDALFFVGNMDPEVSLELVSKSAKYVDRSVLYHYHHNPNHNVLTCLFVDQVCSPDHSRSWTLPSPRVSQSCQQTHHQVYKR